MKSGFKYEINETKIWVKEWEDFKKVVEFKFVGDDSAKPGGIINVPFPNIPEFQDLARFVVQDYNKKEVNSNDLFLYYFYVSFTFKPIIFKS